MAAVELRPEAFAAAVAAAFAFSACGGNPRHGSTEVFADAFAAAGIETLPGTVFFARLVATDEGAATTTDFV